MLKLVSLVSLLLLLLLAPFVFSDIDDQNTAAMIRDLANRYGDDLQRLLPCIIYPNCPNCTSYVNCVWITKAQTNGITVNDGAGNQLLAYNNVRYCWRGGFFGGWYKLQPIGNEMITAMFGWNDYTFQNCAVRGGIVILLIVFLFIAACCVCFCFGLAFVVYCGKGLRKKLKSVGYVKQEL